MALRAGAGGSGVGWLGSLQGVPARLRVGFAGVSAGPT